MKFIQAVNDSKHVIQPVQRCGPVKVNGQVYASAEVEILQTDEAIICRLRVPVYQKCSSCDQDFVPVKKLLGGKAKSTTCSTVCERLEKTAKRKRQMEVLIYSILMSALVLALLYHCLYFDAAEENRMCRDVPVNGTPFDGPVHIDPYPAMVNYYNNRIVRCPKQAVSWVTLRCDGKCTQFPPNYTSPAHYCHDYPKSVCCHEWGKLCQLGGWTAAVFYHTRWPAHLRPE